MTFFETLKDRNVRAIFAEIAWDRYGDGRPITEIVEDLTFQQRLEIFRLTHKIMRAIGMPGWQEPCYLNVESPKGAAILSRKTRPDND